MSEEQPAEATETEPEATNNDAPIRLPDDHPLVKALAAQKEEIRALKARTSKLDEIEDAQKTEAERAAERIATLERDAASARAEALRFKIASKHGISDEDAALFLTAADEETLTKQAERLAERRTKTANRDPFAGRTPSAPSGSDPKREWLRSVTDRD